MPRTNLPDTEGRRLLGGGIVALVTTSWRGSENVAPIVWHMPLSIQPPLIGIAVHPSRHTHDMIKASEQFALNIPTMKLMKHAHYAGLVSGADMGKVEELRLPTIKAHSIQVPLLDFCLGWIECGLEDAMRHGDHTLFIGKVAAVSVDDDAFDGVWKLDDPELRPLHYLGGPFYGVLGERVEAVLDRKEQESGEEEGQLVPPGDRDLNGDRPRD